MGIEKTVGELARLLGAEAEGNLQHRLSGVDQLESASVTDLSFVESGRNAAVAIASRAGCLLAPAGLALPGKTVIRVRNPRYAMALAIGVFYPQPVMKPGIHPTAQIGNNAAMGDEVSVGAFTVIGDGCRIGART